MAKLSIEKITKEFTDGFIKKGFEEEFYKLFQKIDSVPYLKNSKLGCDFGWEGDDGSGLIINTEYDEKSKTGKKFNQDNYPYSKRKKLVKDIYSDLQKKTGLQFIDNFKDDSFSIKKSISYTKIKGHPKSLVTLQKFAKFEENYAVLVQINMYAKGFSQKYLEKEIKKIREAKGI